MFDLLIKDGIIADGSGDKAYKADLAVLNGKIAEIAPQINSPARRVVDAKGKLVTPGFIDIHRHADVNLFMPSFGEAELRQGLTTIVNGNCGLSCVPCPGKYREEILSFLRPV
ncbi:MAG: amidohydrolase family protein, partial [Oscillospiraceae bacterium]